MADRYMEHSPPLQLSPQNPYESYIVPASAGSGKTYQLSRRFLNLVGAGADPGAILTVTFTRKAAGEMRSRILEEATQLISNRDAQVAFEQRLADYRSAANSVDRTTHSASLGRDPRLLAPLRSAEHTGRLILASSQLLRITTIDSLFYEWVAKFPWEASATDDSATDDSATDDSATDDSATEASATDDSATEASADGPSPAASNFGNQQAFDETGRSSWQLNLPSPFQIIEGHQAQQVDQEAWQAVCRLLAQRLASDDPEAQTWANKIIDALPERDFEAGLRLIEELGKSETYLWFTEATGGRSAFRQHRRRAAAFRPI